MPGLFEATASIDQHSKRQFWMRRVRLLILGLGLALVLLELGLRMVPPASQPGATLGWAQLAELGDAGLFRPLPAEAGRYGLQPGASHKDGELEYVISNQGTRGADFERAKPVGEKRLLLLGSGLAMGLGVAQGETLAERLAALATAASAGKTSWRGINLAVPGYDFAQQAADLEKRGLGFAPDLVLIYYDQNFALPAGFFLGPRGQLHRDRLPLPAALRCLLWKSHLYSWISDRYRASHENSPATIHGLSPNWVRGSTEAQRRAGLARIEALCRAAGVPYRQLDNAQDSDTAFALLKAEGLLP